MRDSQRCILAGSLAITSGVGATVGSTSSGLRHLGHVELVFAAGLDLLERGGEHQDRLAVLDRGHPAHRKAVAIAGAIDVEDDRRGDVAGAQEIGVQRMHAAAVLDGLLRRRQRLAEHLPAEHVLGADVAALAAEQVVFQALEREQGDEFGYDGFGHGGSATGAAIVQSGPGTAEAQGCSRLQAASRQHLGPGKQRARVALARRRCGSESSLAATVVGVEVLVAGDEFQRSAAAACSAASSATSACDLRIGVRLVHRLVSRVEPVRIAAGIDQFDADRARVVAARVVARRGSDARTDAPTPSRSM